MHISLKFLVKQSTDLFFSLCLGMVYESPEVTQGLTAGREGWCIKKSFTPSSTFDCILSCQHLQTEISILQEQICHLQFVIHSQHQNLRNVIQEVRLTGEFLREISGANTKAGQFGRLRSMACLLTDVPFWFLRQPGLGLLSPRVSSPFRFCTKRVWEAVLMCSLDILVIFA